MSSSSSSSWAAIETGVKDIETIIANLKKDGAAVDAALKHFNEVLAQHTFLVNNRLTAADNLMYASLYPLVSKWNAKTQQQYLNIVRWFDLIQHSIPDHASPLVALTTTLPETPELKSGPAGASSRIAGFPVFSSPASVSPSVPSSSSSSPAPAPTQQPCSSTETSKPAPQKQAQQQKQKASAPPDAKPAPQSNEKPPAGGRAAGKGPAAPRPAPAPKKPVLLAPADYKAAFGRLNIIVGRIVSAAVHPNADTMYVEQIDLGEANPRQVVSGLRNFISLDDFIGMKVICLANLKEAKLRQVSSAAMVLCASNADHTLVEVLTIDDSVPVGERLFVPGFEDAADESLNPKHKVWELVRDSHHFIVGQDGTVQFESVPLQSKNGHHIKVSKSSPGDLIG